MNISDIITKCYILALIIRDDGERLLLGDGFYEFKEQLQHFQPNTFQNDVIELQGTDGQLLAGQVRRGATQSFDGYIADSTTSREATEEHRQRFLAFFRKKHHYKVVYVFPDGSAIKRERGYIVDAPSVPEMFQRFPEFHVGLNFEDVNYYEYNEGEDGEEIFAHVQNIAIAGYVEGGLIWDAFGAVSNEITWVDYVLKTTTDGYAQITDGVLGAPLNFEQIDGNATQETFTGKNKANIYAIDDISGWVTLTVANDKITISNNQNTAGYTNCGKKLSEVCPTLQVGDVVYVFFDTTSSSSTKNGIYIGEYWSKNTSKTITQTMLDANVVFYGGYNETAVISNFMITATNDATYEKFVGGIPAPNPDFPQTVNTVTGRQEIKITGKNLFDNRDADYAGAQAYLGYGNATYTHTDTTYSMPDRFGAIAFEYDHLIEGEKYTISFDVIGSAQFSARVGLNVYNGSPTEGRISYEYTAKTTAQRINWTFTAQAENRIAFNSGTTSGTNIAISNIQLELGEQVTSFEPFHGQSYEINLGKNLLNASSIIQGTWNNPSSSNTCVFFMPIIAGETYTISNQDTTTYRFSTGISTTGTNSPAGTATQDSGWQTGASYTITAQTTGFLLVQFRLNSSADITPSDIPTGVYQIERGSQATPFASYKTPIELAGIGPIQSDGLPQYHDSFKRIDGVWYKHAEIKKVVLDGRASEGWQKLNLSFQMLTASSDKKYSPNLALSDHFTFNPVQASITANLSNGEFGFNTSKYLTCRYDTASTVNDFKDWLKANNTSVYYIIDTPTDTAITDTDLLAQLNAIASTYDGVNNITIIPSAGAQGELEVRYSRGFIPVGAGYVWDAAQGGGPNVVSVDGIDHTGFVWEVVGPATNPTLTNITTNQTMTFEGDVATGQTLTVNTSDQTAEIAGTNVFAQMEGDWMQLAPGNNVITYTATGATEPSKIKWNGVVG